MRVLVTGSRDWPYSSVIERELNDLVLAHPLAFMGDDTLTVVEGTCPTGADEYAYRWALRMATGHPSNVESERHPAAWKTHGNAAGLIRNQEMVDAGADLCLAFRYMGSKGTMDCVNRASVAGIPIRMLELDLIELKGKA